jgi:hypothetical protein
LALLVPALRAAVWDFPALNTASPIYSKLYSDVLAGNTTATGTAFAEANETLNCVYAYLHPQSPYRYNPAYLVRLRTLLSARFGQWKAGSNLNDMSAAFHSMYAYMLMAHYRPADVSDLKADLEAGIVRFCDDALARNPLLYDQNILANLWLNGDIRLALGIYFGGVALGNTTYQSKAFNAIELVMSQTAMPDGGTHYVGFNNEASTYHDESVLYMLWWWKTTGSSAIKATIDQTVKYVPLTVEPSGFQEQSTGIPYKHMYNGLRGLNSALAKAYLYGERYNYYFGKGIESSYNEEWSLMHAILYRGGLSTATPPDGFIVKDRNILGPRGRFGTWAFVANGRNPQEAAPEHVSQGYDGMMCGKNTFVGALTLGPYANGTSLNAAFDGAAPEFKHATGAETDWARGAKYRFLSQDEQTSTITRRGFGTLSTAYRLSTRTSSSATANWGAGTAWLGRQLWFMNSERIVGLVQLQSESSQTVYGLDARIVLSGGRKSVIGSYRTLTTVDRNTYQFGNLQCKLRGDNFGGTVTTERLAIQNGVGDDYSALLRIHDQLDLVNDAAVTYPAGTLRWAVIECAQTGTALATQAVNALPADASWAVLDLSDASRGVRIIQNITAAAKTYTGTLAAPYANASLHRSWSDTVDTLPVANSQVALSISVPAYGHAIVLNSAVSQDHQAGTLVYEDLFPIAISPTELQAWRSQYFGTTASIGIAADLADPDGDGLSNLLEYALGGNPLTVSPSLAPVLGVSANHLTLTFTRQRADIIYTVEASNDMVDWSATIPFTLPALGQSVTVTDTVDLLAQPRRFLRLRVAAP